MVRWLEYPPDACRDWAVLVAVSRICGESSISKVVHHALVMMGSGSVCPDLRVITFTRRFHPDECFNSLYILAFAVTMLSRLNHGWDLLPLLTGGCSQRHEWSCGGDGWRAFWYVILSMIEESMDQGRGVNGC